MANEGKVQVGKPDSLPEKQCNMQDKEWSPKAYTESQSESHLLAFLCTKQNIYVYSHDCVESVLIETDSINFPDHMPSPALMAHISVCNSFLQVPWAISYQHNLPPQNAFSRVCLFQSLSIQVYLKFIYLLSFTVCPEGQLTQTSSEWKWRDFRPVDLQWGGARCSTRMLKSLLE